MSEESKTFTLFLIDDDPDDQEIMRYALQGIGKQVTLISASDGVEALEMLERNESLVPDLVFLDLNMPRMNGKECLGKMRRFFRLNEIPIIIYSTSTAQSDIIETHQLGATDYVSKQESIANLKATLLHLFQKYKV